MCVKHVCAQDLRGVWGMAAIHVCICPSVAAPRLGPPLEYHLLALLPWPAPAPPVTGQLLVQVPHLRGLCGCSALSFKIRAGLAESPRPYVLLASCMCRVRVRWCLEPRRVSGVAFCLVVPVFSQWKRHKLSSQGNGSWGGDSDLEASQRLDLCPVFGRAMLVISVADYLF